ncbi:MAG: hypothetical protein K2Y71_12540 [Xanthobacteraceae bacterium]|nr:hypothetical protein [Xanthobacteraceae bacterium]
MNVSTNIFVEELNSIRSALLRLSGSRVTGSQLRQLVDATCPGFDVKTAAGTNVGALTTLLKRHYNDIVHLVGKAGGDNIFLIGGADPNPVQAAAAPRPVSLWTAFASPALGHEVVYDRDQKSLTTQVKGATLLQSQVRLAAPSNEEFHAIAQEFIQSAPTDMQEQLQKILGLGDRFYLSWISFLKVRDTAVYHRWGLFRVKRIVDLLRNRLVEAKVPVEEVDKAVELLGSQQQAAYQERAQAIRQYMAPPESPPAQGSSLPVQVSKPEPADVENARAVAIAAIKNMSLTEIRQITLPLGAIIDAALLLKKSSF